MYYSMTDGEIFVAVEPKGAEMLSLCDMTQGNKEYIWSGDERYWPRHAPNLFPFVGSIFGGKYSYDGKEFDFGLRHGFARYMKFDLTAHSEKSMTFSLRSDCETKAKYPFDFEFSVRYDLLGNKTLGVTYTVKNISAEKEMIFAVGGHPGFRVPINAEEKFEDYYLEFPEKSCPERYFPTDDGFMKEKPEAYSLEDGVRLSLRHDLFDNDAVVLAGTPKTVCLKSKNGSNGVKMNFDGFGMLGIWHTNKSDAPFVCLEPWNGHTAFVGEKLPLEEKPDMLRLKPRDEYSVGFTIEIF